MQDKNRQFSWDDLQIIRAVGRSGALAPAADLLGINVSTIARRLTKLEESLGIALFERRRTGYQLTRPGEELMALAERVELDVVSITRRISGQQHGHAGDLKITTSDSLLLHFLSPIIADFKANNSAIRVEVIVGNSPLNLARGESDIAIRATDKPPENLFGRKVASIAWAPYARLLDSSSLRFGMGALGERQWVSFGGELSELKARKFLEERVRPEAIVYRTDSVAGAAAGIAAGLGVGYLPCMLGDLSPDLARIGAIEPELSDELWLLTHPDIRKSGRVYAFMAHCAESIVKHRNLIEGLRDQVPDPTGVSKRYSSNLQPVSMMSI